MLETMGLIFASNNEAQLGELTRLRTACAVPYAGRYRLIDFVLSAMVNSGIDNVGVATDHGYQSLLSHLGNGKQWDLARKNQGLIFLPPYSREVDITDDSRITLLSNALSFLRRSKQRFVVVCDSTNVCNVRFNDLVDQHKRLNSDITVVYQHQNQMQKDEYYIELNKDKKVIALNQTDPTKKLNRLVGFYVFSKDLLIKIVEECQLSGRKNFVRDVIERNIPNLTIHGFEFSGFLKPIKTLQNFYDVSMDLLEFENRQSLFMSEDKILTKSKDRVPTRYRENSQVKNSIIADGCIIDGKVENSIISRGVTVGKGANVSNCIIMPDGTIEENATITCCILDKNVTVRSGKTLVGQCDFPIVVGKRRTI